MLGSDAVVGFETQSGKRWISAISDGDEDTEAGPFNGIRSVGAIPGQLGAPAPRDPSAVDATPHQSSIEALDEYLRIAGDDLRERRGECFARSRQTFVIMVSLAVMSLVVFSLTALVTGLNLSAGTIAPSCISALLASATAPAWKLYQAENARAAQFDRDLVRLEKMRVARAFGVKRGARGSQQWAFGPIPSRPTKKSSPKGDAE